METFPSFRYGPAGASAIFDRPEDVPKGWEDHPRKVADFKEEFGPLDHDHDGHPGGSTSAVEDIKALRAAYALKVGRKAFPGWDAAELKRRMI